MCKKAHADGTALPAKRFGLAAKSDPTLPTYVHTVMKDGRPTLAYTNKRTGVRQGFQTGTYEQMKALAIAFAEKQQVPPANQENSNTVMNQIHSQASDISTTGQVLEVKPNAANKPVCMRL